MCLLRVREVFKIAVWSKTERMLYKFLKNRRRAKITSRGTISEISYCLEESGVKIQQVVDRCDDTKIVFLFTANYFIWTWRIVCLSNFATLRSCCLIIIKRSTGMYIFLLCFSYRILNSLFYTRQETRFDIFHRWPSNNSATIKRTLIEWCNSMALVTSRRKVQFSVKLPMQKRFPCTKEERNVT